MRKSYLSEPYRYTCPDCGSHSLRVVIEKDHNYDCTECLFKFSKPFDKKTGELAK